MPDVIERMKKGGRKEGRKEGRREGEIALNSNPGSTASSRDETRGAVQRD